MICASIQRFILLLIVSCFAVLPVANTAQAGIITTDTAIDISDRAEQVDRVRELLAQRSVQDAMVKLGVDPAYASERVQSLTPEELQLLESNLADMPAGGVGFVEVVGVVAIVLIVLELLGVTDVFKRI